MFKLIIVLWESTRFLIHYLLFKKKKKGKRKRIKKV
jgi:hypothetical protein